MEFPPSVGSKVVHAICKASSSTINHEGKSFASLSLDTALSENGDVFVESWKTVRGEQLTLKYQQHLD